MTISCPICESDNTGKLLLWESDYHIHSCRDCDAIFTVPMPDEAELKEFYQGFLHRKPKQSEIEKRVAEKKREIIRLFGFESEKSAGNKKFLDVGGGVGIATRAAKEIGFDAYLLEVDEEAIRFAGEYLSIENDKIIKAAEEISDVDFVFCDNVVEHVLDPVDFIGRLHGVLGPSGMLILKTPNGRNTEFLFHPVINMRSYFLRALAYKNSLKDAISAYRHRWWHCDPPRHLYSFSEKTMSKIMGTLGIIDFEVDYYHIPLFHSLDRAFFSKPKSMKKGIKPLIIIGALLFVLIVELLLKPFQLIFRKLGLISPGGILVRIRG